VKSLTVLALTLSLSLGVLIGWCARGPVRSQIAGGESVTLAERPGMISIQIPDGNSFIHWCTGFLVGPQVALTAGHCVPGNSYGIFRVIGEQYLSDNPSAVYSVTNAWVSSSHDAALLMLSGPAGTPAELVNMSDADYKKLTETVAIGFGHNSPNSDSPNELLQLPIGVQKPSSSAKWFIAGDGVTGPCSGDSGGPQLLNGTGSKAIGVLHKGEACNGALQAHYVPISALIRWICDETQGDNDTTDDLSPTNAALCRSLP
jgi:secreted trypsin-like serine protease